MDDEELADLLVIAEGQVLPSGQWEIMYEDLLDHMSVMDSWLVKQVELQQGKRVAYEYALRVARNIQV